MQANQSIPTLLKRLWHHISPLRRGQFGLLLVLMLLASFAEILSIGAVLPFLGVLTVPERVFEHAAAQPIIQALGLTMPAQLLLPLNIVFAVAALIAGTMRLLLLWASTRLSFATGAAQHQHLPPHAVSALCSALRPQQQRGHQRHFDQNQYSHRHCQQYFQHH